MAARSQDRSPKTPDDPDLPAQRLARATHRGNHDICFRQPVLTVRAYVGRMRHRFVSLEGFEEHSIPMKRWLTLLHSLGARRRRGSAVPAINRGAGMEIGCPLIPNHAYTS
jgi:hypothetical protein